LPSDIHRKDKQTTYPNNEILQGGGSIMDCFTGRDTLNYELTKSDETQSKRDS